MIEQLKAKLVDYALWLDTQQLSRHSKRSYLSQAKGLIRFAEQFLGTSGDSAEQSLLARYVEYLRYEMALRPKTIVCAISAAKAFLGFCRIQAQAPVLRRPPTKLLEVLSADQQSKLSQSLRTEPSTRDRAIFMLMSTTAITLQECSDLDLGDLQVSLSHAGIRIGKNERCRVIALNEPTWHALSQWLQYRRLVAGFGCDALFVNRFGQRLSTPAIDNALRKIGIRARMEISARVLRQTRLSSLASSGVAPQQLADLAGYRDTCSVRRFYPTSDCSS